MAANEIRVQVSDVGTGLPLIVSTSPIEDEMRLDIRHFFTDKEGNLRPTRKGINLPLANAQEFLAELESAIQEALA